MTWLEWSHLSKLPNAPSTHNHADILVRGSWNSKALLIDLVQAWYEERKIFIVNPALHQLASFEPFLKQSFLREITAPIKGFTALLATSATGGQAKIVALDRRSIEGNIEVFSKHLGLANQRFTVVLHVPLFHAFGLVLTAMQALLNNHRLILFEKFSPEGLQKFLETYDQSEPIFLPFVPSQLRMLAKLKDPLFSGHGLSVIGGDQILQADIGQLRRLFPAMKHTIGYGLTEAGPALCHTPLDQELAPGMVGVPLAGVALQHQKDGMAFRSSHAGVFAYDTATAQIDFLRNKLVATGDSLSFREGLYWFDGRIKNTIKKHGETIFPQVIESYYRAELPSDYSVVCLGYATAADGRGEEIGLVVSGLQSITQTRLREIGQGLPVFYRPSRCLYLKELPQNSLGKVIYPLLRSQLEAL